jgi:hypothetical protein
LQREIPELGVFFSPFGQLYREFLYFLDEFTALSFTATGAPHINFADESACLMADNVWNEGK